MEVVNFLPRVLGALVIFIVGVLIAAGIGKLVEKIFEAIRLDAFVGRLGLNAYFERAHMRLRVSHFLGRLVYWFLLIAFLLAAVNALDLAVFADFLRQVLLYLANVVVAVLIMIATLLLARFVKGIVMAASSGARLTSAGFLASLAWWAVALFGFFAALLQLGIAASLINTIVMGVIAMLALAGGLAFGLGGREAAAEVIRHFREDLR
jgi:hypothetical protein